ncbi:MAG: hypothetical protein IJQ68_06715 [Methanobrevibacter sp.]|uniref:hypothetical protein n=1 Tax=Methanobrevibacter sp. TaxID=66852 RepID=UPI0025FD4510|nr:hypothetical protein [Methanobrevibacter sp.]MBR0271663.1 hypothetical protein [Methanobrevibacter sp.]
MVDIKEIDSTIREMIRIDESLVSAYDPQLLCEDYKNSLNSIKSLLDEKKELRKTLEKSLNEFFEVDNRFALKKIKIASFNLILNPISGAYMFSLPKFVDKSSRQYFCYITMMNRLEREYNVIERINDTFFMADITLHLNLEKLF